MTILLAVGLLFGGGLSVWFVFWAAGEGWRNPPSRANKQPWATITGLDAHGVGYEAAVNGFDARADARSRIERGHKIVILCNPNPGGPLYRLVPTAPATKWVPVAPHQPAELGSVMVDLRSWQEAGGNGYVEEIPAGEPAPKLPSLTPCLNCGAHAILRVTWEPTYRFECAKCGFGGKETLSSNPTLAAFKWNELQRSGGTARPRC